MRGIALFSRTLFGSALLGCTLLCRACGRPLRRRPCCRALLGRQPLCCGGTLLCGTRTRRCSLRCRRAMRRCITLRRCRPLCGGRPIGGRETSMDAWRQAAQEALFCEAILAKSGDNILLETLRGASPVTWEHYPPGDVFDRDSGAQWYYHSHSGPPGAAEHGHFHCFMRPQGKDGPIHHLIAIGVDAYGRATRLFTVNQWVVDDVWADAPTTIALLDGFDVHMARPSYLVNRWLTAMVGLYRDEIAALILTRDTTLAAHVPPEGIAVRQDRELEVVSQCTVDLASRAAAFGL